MIVLAGARVVTPDGVLDPGTLVIDGDRIVDVHAGGTRGFGHTPLDGHVVVPGFIDLHVHGIEGFDTLASDDGVAAIAARLPARGVTSFCPTTVACGADDLRRVLADVRRLRARPGPLAARVLPAHLESNFIDPGHRGAQPVECLCLPPLVVGPGFQPRTSRTTDPGAEAPGLHGVAPQMTVDADEILAVIDAAGPDVGIVTLAPELPGGLDLVRHLVASGRRVSLGHTGASYEQALAAIDAGARHATHLFNAMPPLLHRAPGAIAAILERQETMAEIVVDGHHVHAPVVRMALALLGRDRVLAITDGTAGAGLPDGARTRIGPHTVTVGPGTARLADGSMAGSLLTLDQGFRNLVGAFGLDLPAAVRACSTNPARALGLQALGAIVPGALADLAVLDPGLRVVQCYVGGRPQL
jgi:N-acetylglucosamine-6-phosphate deacetylase